MTERPSGIMPIARELPDPDCPICSTQIPGCLVLDALQVEAARQRWQWADLGPGANDCPCIQAHRRDDLEAHGHRLAMLRAVADRELEQWDAQQRARQEVIWADEERSTA